MKIFPRDVRLRNAVADDNFQALAFPWPVPASSTQSSFLLSSSSRNRSTTHERFRLFAKKRPTNFFFFFINQKKICLYIVNSFVGLLMVETLSTAEMSPTGSDTVQDRYACLAKGAQMFLFFPPQ